MTESDPPPLDETDVIRSLELPLVLAFGAGAEAREALGWIVVGGLGFATIFTHRLCGD